MADNVVIQILKGQLEARLLESAQRCLNEFDPLLAGTMIAMEFEKYRELTMKEFGKMTGELGLTSKELEKLIDDTIKKVKKLYIK